jgi:hypothetical protein
MVDSDEDRGRSRRLGAQDWGWLSTGRILDGRMIDMSSNTVCDLHYAQGDKELGFSGSASKPRLTVSPDLASKLVATVLVVWPRNHSLRFPGWGLKSGSYGSVIWHTKSP